MSNWTGAVLEPMWLRMDLEFIRGAGTNYTPRGILWWNEGAHMKTKKRKAKSETLTNAAAGTDTAKVQVDGYKPPSPEEQALRRKLDAAERRIDDLRDNAAIGRLFRKASRLEEDLRFANDELGDLRLEVSRGKANAKQLNSVIDTLTKERDAFEAQAGRLAAQLAKSKKPSK